jgi:hypothetical protein
MTKQGVPTTLSVSPLHQTFFSHVTVYGTTHTHGFEDGVYEDI